MSDATRPRDGGETRGPPLAVRPGTDHDIPAVLALMGRSLGEGNIPRTREFWAWKHQQNPFGRSPFLLAEAEGQLVGVRVFMRWEWRAGGRTFRAVRAVDTATHPDFQGRGIFKKLTLGLVGEMESEGVAFVFNTPNDQSRPGYLKMGWSSLGRVSLWMRPTRARGVARIAAEVARRAARAASQRLGSPSSVDPAVVSVPSGGGDGGPEPQRDGGASPLPGVRALPPLEGVAPEVFAAPSPERLHTPKSAPYLAWRYGVCPAFAYQVHSTERAVVASRERERFGLRELTLSDVLFERTPRGLAEARRALSQVIAASAADYAIVAPPPDAACALLLGGLGFVPAPRAGPILTVRPLEEPAPAGLLEPRAWAPAVGDLELF